MRGLRQESTIKYLILAGTSYMKQKKIVKFFMILSYFKSYSLTL